MPIPESITVTRIAGDFAVVCGDRSAGHLTPDEALYCVAMFILRESPKYLRTAEEHAAWEANLVRQAEGAARPIGQIGTESKQ